MSPNFDVVAEPVGDGKVPHSATMSYPLLGTTSTLRMITVPQLAGSCSKGTAISDPVALTYLTRQGQYPGRVDELEVNQTARSSRANEEGTNDHPDKHPAPKTVYTPLRGWRNLGARLSDVSRHLREQ